MRLTMLALLQFVGSKSCVDHAKVLLTIIGPGLIFFEPLHLNARTKNGIQVL